MVWASFATFDQAIDEMLGGKTEVISEREAFLLRELQAMLAAEGLVGSNKDVVVLPARNALPEYHEFRAYVCQPGRTFQPVRRMAFYAHGKIHPLVPEILSVDDEVVMELGRYKGRLGQLVENGRAVRTGATHQTDIVGEPPFGMPLPGMLVIADTGL